MLILHHDPGSASFAPHVLLLELGVPFELAQVDRLNQAHQSPAYLRLNPNGKIPVLQDGDEAVFETVAILMHLADRHPAAGLAPALGTHARAAYYQWGLWLSNTLQAMLMHYFYPARMAPDADAATVATIKAAAEARVVAMLPILDRQLARGPWLLGESYSALDPMAFLMCRWTRGFASRPARSHEHLRPYLERMLARPAVARAFATEGLQPPWF